MTAAGGSAIAKPMFSSASAVRMAMAGSAERSIPSGSAHVASTGRLGVFKLTIQQFFRIDGGSRDGK